MAQFLISAFADEASDHLDGQIIALKRNRLRCIEPRSVDGSIVSKSESELISIRKMLDDAEITLSALGSPIGKVNIDDDFAPHLAVFNNALRACRILGTNRMRIFSFFVPKDRLKPCRAEVLRRLSIMLEQAEHYHITLCHENEALIYGQNPDEVRDLLESLPALRGVFDAANFIMNDQDPVDGFEATLPSLEYLHIKDAKADEHIVLPAGEGDGHLPEILQKVDASTNRTVFLTVEPHLFTFQSYSTIDKHEMRVGRRFETSDEAFDCAVSSLKSILTGLDFVEGEDGIWKK